MPPAASPAGETPPPQPDPAIIEPVSGSRERTVPFRFGSIDGHDVIVEVQIGGPPCDTITAADTAESATEVRITLWAGQVTGATCTDVPAMLGTFRVRIPLAEPLGNRSLVSGA